MTTVDRVVGYENWNPTTVVPGLDADEDSYVGKHRKPGARAAWGLMRHFYRAKHQAR